jgi:hypothetical protein
MASDLRITQTEILDALALAAPGNASKDARTVKELSEETGMRRQQVCEALARLKLDGRLKLHRVQRERIDGFSRHVPAYTILPAKKR